MKALALHLYLDRETKNFAIYHTKDGEELLAGQEVILYLPLQLCGKPTPQRVDIAVEEVEE